LKNIKFIKTNDGETCEIDKQDESLVKTCQLLQVDAKQMNESLSQMMINHEKFRLNIQKLSDRRNNLTKQLYKELF
jgi:myosin heavy subunit